jgi:hypothetical protein
LCEKIKMDWLRKKLDDERNSISFKI